MPASKKVDLHAAVRRNLLKREQTLAQIAARIGHGITVKHLTRTMAAAVRDGVAVRHPGRPPRYSKS